MDGDEIDRGHSNRKQLDKQCKNFPADAIMYYSYYLLSIHSLDFHVSSPHMTNTYVSGHMWTHTGL